MARAATIYKITSPDGRLYIGSTRLPLNIRMSNHRSDARLGKHPNVKLYQAMRASDPYLFTIEAICDVDLPNRYRTEGEHVLRLRTHIEGFNSLIPGRTRSEQVRAYRLAHPERVQAQAERRRLRRQEARRWGPHINPDGIVIREYFNGEPV